MTHPMASQGRYGDDHVVHVATGEMIVPKPVLDENPQLARYISAIINNSGMDSREYVVGSRHQKINPITGQPEYWPRWFKKLWKGAQKVLPVAAAFIASGGNPLAAAAAAAAGTAVRGGDLSQMITSAGYGYGAGGLANAGANAFTAFGTSGPEAAFDSLGRAATSMGGTTDKIFSAVNTANSFFNKKALRQQKIGDASPNASEAPQFYPKRPASLSRPASLNELGAFSPEQERSYLATRGKNTGLGSEEDQYYNNLVQRSLIGEGNKVDTSNPNFLMPIESSYYSGQGRNTSDVMEFLRSLQA